MRALAAVITISDKGYRGEREDTSGPALVELLEKNNWKAAYTAIVPDETEQIQKELRYCADELKAALVLTTGGTGFSPRDNTPEATLAVIQREARGIPEMMRAASMRITDRGCLSRAAAGIRGQTLIVNLPGSRKAALENIGAVLGPIRHGVEMLLSEGSADCGEKTASVCAVCTSKERGTRKQPVEEAILLPGHGIYGDAHAGNWNRQVSLLARESVEQAEKRAEAEIPAGAFGENILTEGICLYELPPGTRLRIGTAVCEVTQIGKECHKGCEIRRLTGDCVMPREGIFVKVIKEGHVKAGDMMIRLK